MRKLVTNRDNFTYLFVSLILLFFASAAMQQLALDAQYLIASLFIVSMIIAVWSVQSSRFAFHTGIGLISAVIIISLAMYWLDHADYEIVNLLLILAFLVMTLYFSARQVIFSGVINGNILIGSICIYLLLGLIWTMLYLLLLQFVPEAFSGIEASSWNQNFQDMTYFSFITLTTLGYGDIFPLTPMARFLVFLEVVFGVFYMAIFVSSLVGARMSGYHQS